MSSSRRNSVADAVYFWLELGVARGCSYSDIILVAFGSGLVALNWVPLLRDQSRRATSGLTLDGSKPYAGTA
jgi:hypothetical protein